MSANPSVAEASCIPHPKESERTRAGGASAGNDPAGRAANGQFAKGNPGGPGNPFNRQVAALRRALLVRVTAEDLEEVLAVLLIKAKTGDLAAIKLLLSYTIGKPGPAVDPDTLDQQEWQMHQQAAVPPQQVHDLMDAMPAATANLMAQVAWPCAAQQSMQPVVEGLRAAETAAATAPAPTPAAQEMAGARSSPPTAGPSRDRTQAPSPNGRIRQLREPLPVEQHPAAPSWAAFPVPLRPPDNREGANEQSMRDRFP